MLESARSLLKLIYRIGMTLVTLVLAAGTVLAYVSATPANGLLLVSGILAILTLMAGVSIPKLDWRNEQAERLGQIGAEFRELVQLSTSHVHTEPEVHRVDSGTVDEARRMAAGGAPIDDICQMIDPAHEGNDRFHQDAFRRIVQAMIDG
jgi:hypothetical protein